MRVSVLGAGNAGVTLAFHLVQIGHDVALFEHPSFEEGMRKLKLEKKIIALENQQEFKAVLSGESTIQLVTTNIKEAVEFSKVLMLIVPAFAQEPIMQSALEYLTDEHVVISLPGNFASISFAKMLQEAGCKQKPTFVDTDSIPYACRKVSDTEIFISGMKKVLHAGVFPGDRTDDILKHVQQLFTLELRKCSNVLESNFLNMNMVVHPPPVLLNAGWIETTGGKFSFYDDGCSPSVCRAIDQLDQERMKIAEKLKLKTFSFVKTDQAWYGDTNTTTTYEHLQAGAFHTYFPAPSKVMSRYISEDICYVLLPIAKKLASHFDIATPFIDSFVAVAEVVVGEALKPQRDFDFILKPGISVDDLRGLLQSWN